MIRNILLQPWLFFSFISFLIPGVYRIELPSTCLIKNSRKPNLAGKTALAYFGPCSTRVKLKKGGIHSIMDPEYDTELNSGIVQFLYLRIRALIKSANTSLCFNVESTSLDVSLPELVGFK